MDARLRKLLTIECILSLKICSLSGFSMELLTVESRLRSEDGEFDLEKKCQMSNVKLDGLGFSVLGLYYRWMIPWLGSEAIGPSGFKVLLQGKQLQVIDNKTIRRCFLGLLTNLYHRFPTDTSRVFLVRQLIFWRVFCQSFNSWLLFLIFFTSLFFWLRSKHHKKCRYSWL